MKVCHSNTFKNQDIISFTITFLKWRWIITVELARFYDYLIIVTLLKRNRVELLPRFKF